MNRKYPKNIFEYFGNGLLVFAEILLIQRSSVHKKWGVGTTNLGEIEARVPIKSPSVGIVENLWAPKIENYI